MGILDRFEESPFEPLAEHRARVRECVLLTMPMFECVRRGDYAELQRLTGQVFKTEHKADEVKDEIRRRIPKAFSLPVFRGDLLTFLKLQDDMADAVEDIAVILTIKKLTMPPAIADDVLDYVRRVLKVCDLLEQATAQLTELAEEDFGGGRRRPILALAAEAERAEWEADKAQYALARKLFALEDEIRATDIFLWSSVFKELGRLANHADKTADRLRRMLAR
ncbi:MAG: TIGR00153 family protein [Planctomycetes bacterium]|nr:TIGR00153 family protein [Planctomycetota bacterium]